MLVKTFDPPGIQDSSHAKVEIAAVSSSEKAAILDAVSYTHLTLPTKA